jgi:hypothetical protein
MRGYTAAILCVLGLLLCAALFVGAVHSARINVKPSAIDDTAAHEAPRLVNPAPATSQHTGGGGIDGEVITLRPFGFDPSEIARTNGRFTLLVDNRTGLDEVHLRLDREAGGRVHEVRVPRRKLDWVQGVDLPPGRYLLTDANHPDWVCRITITPR